VTDENTNEATEREAQTDGEAEVDLNTDNEELRYRISQLEESVATRDSELNSLKESLSKAVARYRDAVLAGAPDVPSDLLKGETVEEIDDSLERAKDIVSQVRQRLDASAADSIPAGAPPRTEPDLSALSPVEKIAYGMAQKR